MYPLWDKIQSCPTLFVKHVIVSQQATSLLSFQINSMQTSQNKTRELLNMKTRVLLNMKKYYFGYSQHVGLVHLGRCVFFVNDGWNTR